MIADRALRPAHLAAALALAATGCARPRPASAPRTTVAYRFVCAPRDAILNVDEVNLGQCVVWERRAVGLGPGTHRVRIERDGYLPHESELPGQGARGTIHVELRERPE